MLAFCLFLQSLVFSLQPLHAQELFGNREDVIPDEVEKMYVKGLRFLVENQTREGTWGDPYGAEPAVVGLAVLSMLAHGDDPNFGPYAKTIQRGLNHILSQAKSANGYIGSSMYNHGFSTLALAESYGAVDDSRLMAPIGPALERAVGLILSAQKNNPMGAWRYSPESPDADTTVSGAQMVALFAARNAGIAVPEEAIQKGIKFFLSCQTPEGGFGYTNASGPNAPRSAIGTLILELARQKNTQPFKSAFQFLKEGGASDDNYHHYYLYYASQAFFQASPEAWKDWNPVNIKSLSATQNPNGSWDGQFGPVFSTATSLLSLALNYRYLPIYER